MKKTFLLLAAMCCLVINLNAAKLTNVKFIDNNGKEQTCPEATIVENASKPVYWEAGWYVVNSDVTLSEGAICTGGGGAKVYLILMDGKTLTVNGKDQGKGYPGIDVSATFAIFGQANQTGALVAHGTGSAAGIGVGGEIIHIVGIMFIFGGNITSYGGPDGGSGIGVPLGCSGATFDGIDIKRANVFAAGEGGSAAISVGDVKIATDLVVKADNNNPPTTIIANDGKNLSGKIKWKYVSIERAKPSTYTITATATNGTVVGGGEYAPGATVTLGVIPNAGYEFTEWSDGSKDNPYTFTATKDVTLEATCSLKKITVTTTATNGTVLGGGQYEYGATVTLGAIPNHGYEFKEWSDGTKDNPYIFTATKNVTLEAIFVEISEGLDDVNANANANRKLMRDGQLLILRNGHTYNTQGARL